MGPLPRSAPLGLDPLREPLPRGTRKLLQLLRGHPGPGLLACLGPGIVCPHEFLLDLRLRGHGIPPPRQRYPSKLSNTTDLKKPGWALLTQVKRPPPSKVG